MLVKYSQLMPTLCLKQALFSLQAHSSMAEHPLDTGEVESSNLSVPIFSDIDSSEGCIYPWNMTLTNKALFIGEFIGLTAIFVVMSPVVALAILSAGYHSAKDDIEERRKWHAEQLRKGRLQFN